MLKETLTNIHRRLRSSLRQAGTQIGVTAQHSFVPEPQDYSATYDDCLQYFQGVQRVFSCGKPIGLHITERLFLTYTPKKKNKATGDIVVSVNVPDAEDVVLSGAFISASNCFTNAPTFQTGVDAIALNQRNILTWPNIFVGEDLTLMFGLSRTIFNKIRAPKGYQPIPANISVTVRASLFIEHMPFWQVAAHQLLGYR